MRPLAGAAAAAAATSASAAAAIATAFSEKRTYLTMPFEMRIFTPSVSPFWESTLCTPARPGAPSPRIVCSRAWISFEDCGSSVSD